MKSGLAIAGRCAARLPRGVLVLACGALLLAGGACSKDVKGPKAKETTVLSTRSGETGIQVTESTEGGTQIVRIKTTFQGQESVVSLAVDQPVYEIDIPLSIQQVVPRAAGAGAGGGEFQGLLIAQYLEKAQASMLEGNYNEALKQVNLVLMVSPQHVKSHEMKGSVYYAMGNYQLANEEWEQVLALDPSNQEVRDFMEFNQKNKGADRPPLPNALRENPAAPPTAPPGANPAAPPPAAAPSAATPSAGPPAEGAAPPAPPQPGGNP